MTCHSCGIRSGQSFDITPQWETTKPQTLQYLGYEDRTNKPGPAGDVYECQECHQRWVCITLATNRGLKGTWLSTNHAKVVGEHTRFAKLRKIFT